MYYEFANYDYPPMIIARPMSYSFCARKTDNYVVYVINAELKELFNKTIKTDIVGVLKSRRLSWAGHVPMESEG